MVVSVSGLALRCILPASAGQLSWVYAARGSGPGLRERPGTPGGSTRRTQALDSAGMTRRFRCRRPRVANRAPRRPAAARWGLGRRLPWRASQSARANTPESPDERESGASMSAHIAPTYLLQTASIGFGRFGPQARSLVRALVRRRAPPVTLKPCPDFTLRRRGAPVNLGATPRARAAGIRFARFRRSNAARRPARGPAPAPRDPGARPANRRDDAPPDPARVAAAALSETAAGRDDLGARARRGGPVRRRRVRRHQRVGHESVPNLRGLLARRGPAQPRPHGHRRPLGRLLLYRCKSGQESFLLPGVRDLRGRRDRRRRREPHGLVRQRPGVAKEGAVQR